MKFRPKFPLRWLFVVTALVAIPLAWHRHYTQQLQARRIAIERIEELGGFVTYDDGTRNLGQSDPWQDWGGWLFADERALFEIDGIVFSQPTTAADSAFRILAEFPNLRYLGIDSPDIPATALVHLGHVPDLEGLYIPSIDLSEDAVARIGKLQHLKRLLIKRSTPQPIQLRLRSVVPDECEIETLDR